MSSLLSADGPPPPLHGYSGLHSKSATNSSQPLHGSDYGESHMDPSNADSDSGRDWESKSGSGSGSGRGRMNDDDTTKCHLGRSSHVT